MEYTRIIKWLTDYKEKTGCKGVVLGLSGGKDSTTVAMLAKKVWGKNVFAVLMPNGNQKDLPDAIQIAKVLELEHSIVPIGDVYDAILKTIEFTEYMDSDGLPLPLPNCAPVSEKAKTNIPPRIRMTVLYAIAQSMGYRVIGTGNKSEGYVGWCTKWGDCACDLNPIASLTCTEVIILGKILAKQFGLDERYIVKPPADGLTGKTDEENLGFTYTELDTFLLTGTGHPEFVATVDKLHRASEHKRNMPLTCE